MLVIGIFFKKLLKISEEVQKKILKIFVKNLISTKKS